MHGWFKKLLKSRVSLPTQHKRDGKVTAQSVAASTTPSSSLCSSSSPRTHAALSSLLRRSRPYDVFVCHSSADGDSEEAGRLVSFLEASPRSLRCFLRQRDECPGSAIPTEVCQAVQNSHLCALLITPDFLRDDWCQYMMYQALAEGPMSNRVIPLLQNLSHSQYPQELKFYIYIDLSRNLDRGYMLLSKTVLKYLEDQINREKELECSTRSSITG